MQKLIDSKKNNRVFIVGGGASVNSFDLSKLIDEDVIACNNAYQIVPHALCVIFSDKPWINNHYKELKKFNGLKVCATAYNLEEFRNKITIDVKLNRGASSGISTDTYRLCGGNTGHMAINLALLMGYGEVYLIGFDMDSTSKKLHWHPEHPTGTNVGMYSEFLKGFSSIPKEYSQNIFNLNPKSKIKCFEFKDYDSLFHQPL
jgi:hypothetical protein